MANNRKKGHDLERQVARDLKPYFNFVKTSRASSKMLDDCGVDINFVPMLIQCKSGYERARPKFDDELKNVNENIKKHFPPNHSIHKLPFVLIHKLDRKGTIVTLDYELFKELLKAPVFQELPSL